MSSPQHPSRSGRRVVAADAVLVGSNTMGIHRVVQGGLLLEEAKTAHYGSWVEDTAQLRLLGNNGNLVQPKNDTLEA